MIDDPKAFNRKLGNEIKAARRTMGLSQEELAVLINLSRTSIANIEAGRQGISAFQKAKFDHILSDPATALEARRSRLLLKLARVNDDLKKIGSKA